jgi:hypothetical protein
MDGVPERAQGEEDGRPPAEPRRELGSGGGRGVLLQAGTAVSDAGAGSWPSGRREKLPVPWETERSAPA